MPNYSTKTYNEIAGLLTAQGSRVGTFNQGTFSGTLGVKTSSTGTQTTNTGVGGRSLGGGLCAGVCLDWIRRVLLGRPDRDASSLTYKYETLQAGGTTDQHNRAFDNTGRMAQAWYQSNDMSWTKPGGASASTPFTVSGSEWSATADVLDRSFDQQRRDAGRHTSSKHFSSLTMTSSSLATYSRASLWMGAIMGGNSGTCQIPIGQATYLGFSRPSSSGHAVAVWRRRDNTSQGDSFYFFDPNFGVFSYNANGLQVALQILFWMDSSDTPYYNTCASSSAQSVKIMMFGPGNRVDATPVRPTPVRPTPVRPTPVQSTPTVQASPPTVQPTVTPTRTVQPSVRPSPTSTPPVTQTPTSTPSTYGSGPRTAMQLWLERDRLASQNT